MFGVNVPTERNFVGAYLGEGLRIWIRFILARSRAWNFTRIQPYNTRKK